MVIQFHPSKKHIIAECGLLSIDLWNVVILRNWIFRVANEQTTWNKWHDRTEVTLWRDVRHVIKNIGGILWPFLWLVFPISDFIWNQRFLEHDTSIWSHHPRIGDNGEFKELPKATSMHLQVWKIGRIDYREGSHMYPTNDIRHKVWGLCKVERFKVSCDKIDA